jgi:MoxR-like ATPase
MNFRILSFDMNLEDAIPIAKKEWEENPQLEKDRDEVITKYGEMFKLENIDNLTIKDIQGFWNFKNNKHWSNLDRPAGWVVKDIPKLKSTLKILLDEQISLTDRIRRIREKTSVEFLNYFGNSLYTPILLVTNPKKYPVVNAPVLDALNKLNLYPTKNWKNGKIEWETVPEVQKIILNIAAKNNFDLWQIDWLWWKIARPEEKWDSNLSAEETPNYFIITQNQGSKYDDVDGKQYQYDSQKANYTKFIVGSKFITQSQIKYRRNYFTGFGKIEKIKEEKMVNDKGKSIPKFTAIFSEYEKFDSPKVRTDDILDEMKSLPAYGSMPPSILPITPQLFKKITTEVLGEDISNEHMGSSHAELLEDKKQVIFFGPPGTGKTRAGRILAKSFIEKNRLSARDFEMVEINKIVQKAEVNSLSDNEYQEYVLGKIEEEAKNAGFSFTQENNSEHLYSLKKNDDEIRIGVNFSSSSKQNSTDVYLGVPTKMVNFLSNVPTHNRYQLVINCSEKNFILLPFEITQKFARFVAGTESGKWDSTGKEQHAFHVTIKNDTAELPVRDGTHDLKFYDCEKFTRNIKMMFDDFIRNITFHPSYSYEEFVEGIRPKLNTGNISYDMQDGIFKSIANDARNDPNNKYILFIDEINRGNISKIFGELITLIENDKRETHHSTLTYTKESFTVPKNLYIIGTMNTADKSLSLLDVALRRRFGFIELMPKYSVINEEIEVDDEKFKLDELLVDLNKKIKKEIGRERQIGHSYFMKFETPIKTGKQLQSAFVNEIVPLLQEYLYEDNESLLEILGEGFVNKKELELEEKWTGKLEDFKHALKKIPKLPLDNG